jgi:formiminotetrahydrofolate cyclodeaminase
MALVDKSVRDLLAAFSSSDPTPGGGSAAALASAVGASLLMMVAALPKTRAGSDDDRAALARATTALDGIRRQLTGAIDEDTGAYDQVVAAYKLPKGTDEEKGARKNAVQQALRAATDVPLGVMRLSAAGLDAANIVASHGHRGASSDVGAAIALLRAGLHGARLNVEINLGGIADEPYKQSVAEQVAGLVQQASAAADAAERALAGG